MDLVKEKIRFPYSEVPKAGEATQIYDGVYWIRMALPMLIDHVNIYVLEESDGLTIVDTGLNCSDCRLAWKEILSTKFSKKIVKKIVITHHHPDHIGLLGWFAERYDIEVLISRTSWLLARMLYLENQEKPSAQALDFWKKAGMEKKLFEKKRNAKPFNFSDGVASFPLGFKALNQGDEISLGGKKWRVEIGQGHAPDHITLWGIDSTLIFSGDQVIPGISSNLGVYPTEPLLDTVGLWLASCRRFLSLSKSDHFVLPGHKVPFYGLSIRLKQLIDNHVQAIERIEKKLLTRDCTAVDLFEPIFRRNISEQEYGLALAEAVGHINYFRARNMVTSLTRADGALLFKIL